MQQRISMFFENSCSKCMDSIFSNFECALESKWGPVQEMAIYNNTTEVIWSIDAYARCFFPVVFFILQCCYWTSYLYVLPDFEE